VLGYNLSEKLTAEQCGAAACEADCNPVAANSSQRTVEFLRILGEHERSLHAYVLALVANWADADDIVQETRIRLWEQFERFRPGSDFGAWARSIAYYLALAHREKVARNRRRFSPEFLKAVSAEFAVAPRRICVRQQALVDCLARLDQAKRSLVEQYYSGQQTLHQLAEKLRRSYDATRKALYRTQLALADCINAALRREGEQ
jgi:RNA polymerase sigma-70 factor, ECF subfamily